jgi:hypothetical protein
VQLRLDGTGAETRFRLSAKRTSPCDTAGATVQLTAGSRGVRVSWQRLYCAGEAMLRGLARHAGYPLHFRVAPSFPLPRVAVCHFISNALYQTARLRASEHPDVDILRPENGSRNLKLLISFESASAASACRVGCDMQYVSTASDSSSGYRPPRRTHELLAHASCRRG